MYNYCAYYNNYIRKQSFFLSFDNFHPELGNDEINVV